jgi:C4-type Zn-finger protein
MENFIEVTPSNGQIEPKAYRYKVKTPTDAFMITVLASCGTVACSELKKQLPEGSIIQYDGVSTKLMQVQGVVDVQV